LLSGLSPLPFIGSGESPSNENRRVSWAFIPEGVREVNTCLKQEIGPDPLSIDFNPLVRYSFRGLLAYAGKGMKRDLFDRRVLFVSGKGGVGKTTVSCALALCAARRGKKVLLVETGNSENISFIFGLDRIGYQPQEIYTNVFAMLLEPYAALAEYLMGQIHIRMLVRRFVDNRMFRYLAEVAPGWRELITLGKIWVMERERVRKTDAPLYDLLIVDLPATGHGISFLKVPQAVLDTLSFGPVKKYTTEVQRMLTDAQRTALCAVTLAEEMPVNETLEIVEAAEGDLRIPFGLIFVNAVYPEVFGYGQKGRYRKLSTDQGMIERLDGLLGNSLHAADVLGCADSLTKRRALNERYIKRLQEIPGRETVVLPYVFTEALDVRDLEEFSRILEGELGPGEGSG